MKNILKEGWTIVKSIIFISVAAIVLTALIGGITKTLVNLFMYGYNLI